MARWQDDKHIARAKHIADEEGYDRVIVIGIYPDDRIRGASYGKTKKLCDEAGERLDNIMEAFQDEKYDT